MVDVGAVATFAFGAFGAFGVILGDFTVADSLLL
jgi:hypothetical protein